MTNLGWKKGTKWTFIPIIVFLLVNVVSSLYSICVCTFACNIVELQTGLELIHQINCNCFSMRICWGKYLHFGCVWRLRPFLIRTFHFLLQIKKLIHNNDLDSTCALLTSSVESHNGLWLTLLYVSAHLRDVTNVMFWRLFMATSPDVALVYVLYKGVVT
jgi:hypothetical protein